MYVHANQFQASLRVAIYLNNFIFVTQGNKQIIIFDRNILVHKLESDIIEFSGVAVNKKDDIYIISTNLKRIFKY